MAKKKKLDNLSLDMIQCKADGFGCHYGQWKALNGSTKVDEDEPSPLGWHYCRQCGKRFKPKSRNHFYCTSDCRDKKEAERIRNKNTNYRKRKIAEKRERNLNNENCT